MPGVKYGMDAAFRRYAEHCPDAVLVTDRDGRIEYVNAAFERMTGYSRGELVGRRSAALKSGVHEADFYRALWSTLLSGHEFRSVFTNRKKDGTLYHEDKIIRPLDGGFVSFGRDVTERDEELQRLAHAATHDSLTDLPNRSLFLDRLGQALRQAQRRREPFTLAIVDLDDFRATNNGFGHLAGDAVLQAVADRTRTCLREVDTVARIGGDEFALILPGADAAAAARVLDKVVAANAAPLCVEGRSLAVSVSVGGSTYPLDGTSERELRDCADLRMYEAKRAGGDGYRL